jgi:Family of unknown function (DUF6348)
MPGFFRRLFGSRKLPPTADDAGFPDFGAFPNPGRCSTMTIAFTSARRRWSEQVDLVEVLERVVTPIIGRCTRDGDRLIARNGLRFVPQIVSFTPLDAGKGTKTSTTIAVSHPRVFASSVFEWQHSVGETFEASVTDGFERWAELDLCALVNAIKADDLEVTHLALNVADRDRRVVFSPVLVTSLARPDEPDGDACGHPLGCPCCMFTQCLAVMRPLIDHHMAFGIRLYAGRMSDGTAVADCRVNGADFPAAADALRRYVATWPGTGIQALKQYVVVQTPPIATN